jgi:hypothetical protein
VKKLQSLALLLLLVFLALSAAACGDRLSDGTHFGFVKAATEDGLLFDEASLLTGDEALAAARADGVIGPNETLDDDYYIQNSDTEKVELQVDPDAEFMLADSSTGPVTDRPVSYSELLALWNGTADTSTLVGFAVGELPMHIDISKGRVIGGRQQYLP